jgi:ABC-2 type transport system permease protein
VSGRVSSQPYAFSHSITQAPLRDRLAYWLRILRVIARVEFKVKYVDSALGYFWSLAKPLSYFAVLWFVFGRVFDTGIAGFPLYLLLGIVCYLFLIDATGTAMTSIGDRGALLRRIAFPPLILPVAATLTSLITFGVNSLAVVVFAAFSRVEPGLDWLLIPLLVLELYVFVLGCGLLLAAFFVRFRDVAQIWELGAQLFLFASPIMYPVTLLPEWAQRLALLNPFVQVVQDLRYVIVGSDAPLVIAADVLGGPIGHAVPIAIALATFLIGLVLFRRDAPRFAENV